MGRTAASSYGTELSVETLVDIALAAHDGDEEPTEAAKALAALHDWGGREVFNSALELCNSEVPERRILGARILGELRGPHHKESGERAFFEECCDQLLSMVEREKSPSILRAAIIALGHLGNRRADTKLINLRRHPDSNIRHSIAFALCGGTSQPVIEALLELMEDGNELARDWATTGIGMQVAIDAPHIREALLRRCLDDDEITRAEALHGLVRRRDQRALQYLVHELKAQTELSYLFEDAAKEWLGLASEIDSEPAELIRRLRLLIDRYPSKP